MPTARVVVTSAARTAKIIGGDEILTAEDAATSLFTLNLMLQAWPTDGIVFFHEPVTDLNAEMALPDAFYEGVDYMLAMKLSAQFGMPPDPVVVNEADRARSNLQAATNEAPEVKVDRMLRRMWQNRRWGRYGWFRG